MKKFFKNNLKTILTVGATAVICISGTAFAAFQYNAKQVEYKDGKSVEDALNDLYNKRSMNLEDFFRKKSIQKLYGVTMNKDNNGDYYYNFDGNSYIEINPIPAEFDITDGFKIEFIANCNSLGSYSYVLLLGDDFGVSSYANTNTFRVFGINTGVSIISGEKHKYTIDYDKNSSELKIYIDNEIKYTNTCTLNYTNLNRTTNYIGKSIWPGDAYFSGKIYSIEIMKHNGEKIFSLNTK